MSCVVHALLLQTAKVDSPTSPSDSALLSAGGTVIISVLPPCPSLLSSFHSFNPNPSLILPLLSYPSPFLLSPPFFLSLPSLFLSFCFPFSMLLYCLTHTHTHVHTHTRAHTHISAHTHTHAHTRAHTRAHTHTHTHTST